MDIITVRIWILFFGLSGIAAFESENLFHKSNDIEDGRLNMIELVKKHGYPIEQHKIMTEDGYILNTFRIPHGKHCGNQTEKKSIIVVHGLFSSSYDFVAAGPKKSLAYYLANNCYDIWLANSRGNSVSREHVNLTTSDPKFWDFSWHEMGVYDIPAMIDYILNVTNETSLHYLGHSQGTTQFFVFASERPEYYNKIASVQALSPAVYFDHISDLSLSKIASDFIEPLEILARSFGIYDFDFLFKIVSNVGVSLCKEEYPEILDICVSLYTIIAGVDEPELNKTVISSYLGHFPSGAATKQLYHYAQTIKSGKFRHYDYGIYKNLELYNSMFPPEYNISAINLPISVYYSLNDNMVNPEDAKKVIRTLPNVTEVYEVPFSSFTHIDFVTATDAKILLYYKIVELLKKFDD